MLVIIVILKHYNSVIHEKMAEGGRETRSQAFTIRCTSNFLAAGRSLADLVRDSGNVVPSFGRGERERRVHRLIIANFLVYFYFL